MVIIWKPCCHHYFYNKNFIKYLKLLNPREWTISLSKLSKIKKVHKKETVSPKWGQCLSALKWKDHENSLS